MNPPPMTKPQREEEKKEEAIDKRIKISRIMEKRRICSHGMQEKMDQQGEIYSQGSRIQEEVRVMIKIIFRIIPIVRCTCIVPFFWKVLL